jgi:myo-inositol-1(or 4)-monophosphatase
MMYSTNQTIRETILSSYPSHDFLGEEDVPPGAEASAAAIDEKLKKNTSGFLWIVDPIDGTVSGS